MPNPRAHRYQAARTITPSQPSTRRRKLPLSKFLIVVFLFVTISLCFISIRTILNSNITGQTTYDSFTPWSTNNAQQVKVADSNNDQPVVIAHAISLIKCSKASSVTGFLDAAAILRHSIHKNSIHAKSGGRKSRYSYKMYAIVHTSCAPHSTPLATLGYELLVQDHPVKKEDIKSDWLKNHIEGENCCGSAEFIKLYGKIWFTVHMCLIQY